MRISRIAAVAIGAGLVAAAIYQEWPMVFFCLLGLLTLAVLERI